jgi:PAS domain S-box-containing protein
MATPKHEWLCRSIVDNAPEAVIFASRDGIIRLWNAGAEAIFGHTPEEALGQSLDIIIPENLRNRHWEGYNRTMATGETKYGKDLLAVPGIRKDGTRVSLEFSIVLLRDDGGEFGSGKKARRWTALLRRRRSWDAERRSFDGSLPGPAP